MIPRVPAEMRHVRRIPSSIKWHHHRFRAWCAYTTRTWYTAAVGTLQTHTFIRVGKRPIQMAYSKILLRWRWCTALHIVYIRTYPLATVVCNNVNSLALDVRGRASMCLWWYRTNQQPIRLRYHVCIYCACDDGTCPAGCCALDLDLAKSVANYVMYFTIRYNTSTAPYQYVRNLKSKIYQIQRHGGNILSRIYEYLPQKVYSLLSLLSSACS